MAEYSSLKVTELRDLLKQRGIPSTGLTRKQQIVEALEAHDIEAADAEDQDATEHLATDDAADEGTAQPADATVTDADDAAADVEQDVAVEAPEQTAEQESQPEPKNGESSKEEPSAEDADEVTDTKPPADQVPLDAPESETMNAGPAPQETPKPDILSDSASSEVKKRKRRSPSPALSAGSVSKKLKMADVDAVKLPEDIVAQASHPTVPAVDAVKGGSNTEVVKADVTMEGTTDEAKPADNKLEEQDVGPEDVMDTDKTLLPKMPTPDEALEAAFPQLGASASKAQSHVEQATPSLHRPTAALYIRNLVRPLQPNQLREHLIHLATSPDHDTDEIILRVFHLDSLRSHALVSFDSTPAAVRVRNNLHDCIWPDEPTRKALWVDFIPESNVQEWIDKESTGGNRRDTKRWEVTYTETADGVKASHQEGSSLSSGTPAAMSNHQSGANAGAGMPNAPTGPRGNRPSVSGQPQPQPQKPTTQPQVVTEASNFLDQNFRFTSAKPKIYFQPVGDDLVDRRLDELDSLTSRDWDTKRSGSFTFDSNPRRFTFEDGDRLVDGGPDIGNFGRRAAGAPMLGGGGRGRGRGRL